MKIDWSKYPFLSGPAGDADAPPSAEGTPPGLAAWEDAAAGLTHALEGVPIALGFEESPRGFEVLGHTYRVVRRALRSFMGATVDYLEGRPVHAEADVTSYQQRHAAVRGAVRRAAPCGARKPPSSAGAGPRWTIFMSSVWP